MRNILSNSEFPLPEKTDRLFTDGSKDYRNNAMLNFSRDKLNLYSEGYKLGAKKLLEVCNGDAYFANTLVYPIVFLYRQFIELRLKELIQGLNYVVGNPKDFPNGHDLKILWSTYRKLVEQLGESEKPDKSLLDNTENIIDDFNKKDSSSFAFRYPVDKTPQRNQSLTINILDLTNFGSVMRKIENFMDIQSDLVFHLVDMTDEMMSAAYSDYY